MNSLKVRIINMKIAGWVVCYFVSLMFSAANADTVNVKLDANGGTVHDVNEMYEGGVVIKIHSYMRAFQVGNKYGDFLTDNAGVHHYYLQNDGKTFVGWFTHPRYGKRIESDDVACLGITQLFAHWIDTHGPQLVEVLFDANGGSVNPNKVTYTNAIEYGYLPIPTKPGAKFDGWLSFDRLIEYYDYDGLIEALNNGSLYMMSPSGMTDSDGVIKFGPFNIDEQTAASWMGTNLVATWVADYTTLSHSVTYSPGNFGTGEQQTAIKTNDVALALRGAIFIRTGYTQTGWATSDGGSKAYDLGATYTENADALLYPFWTPKTCTVTFDANGGVGAGDMVVSVDYNSMLGVLPKVQRRTGYFCDGWWTEVEGGTQIWANTIVTGDVTYYAHWIKTDFIIKDNVLLGVTRDDITEVVIPDGVTSIGDGAFWGCDELTSVIIAGSVTSIGEDAFTCCSALTRLVIGNGVTNIGNGAFSGCIGLTSVTIPDSVTSIGSYAFCGCVNLENVTIPNSLALIGESVFGNYDEPTPFLYKLEAAKTLVAARMLSGDLQMQKTDARYELSATQKDRAIASVAVSSDTALDDFVLTNGKVYDSVLYVRNTAENAVRLRLPTGNIYKTFKGATPLVIPAQTQCILTITRIAESVFLVSREDLETVQ